MLVILHYLGYHYQSTRNLPLHFPFLLNAQTGGGGVKVGYSGAGERDMCLSYFTI